MFCPKCGVAVQDDAAFCINCGVKVAAATPNASVIKEPLQLEPSQSVGYSSSEAKNKPPLPAMYNTRPEIKTNVKQGAIIGGWLCFILGLFVMYLSVWAFVIYVPLLLVAAILSIVAMAQRRILTGIALLLATLIVPPIFGLLLSSHRLNKIKENAEQSMRQSAPPPFQQPLKQEQASRNQPAFVPPSLKAEPVAEQSPKKPEEIAEELCAMGKQLAEKGEPGQAMEAYLKGLNDLPNQQSIKDAVAELQKAHPSDPAVFQHLGHTIKADGEIHRIAITPDNRTLICSTGRVQFPGGVYFYDMKDLHPIGWHASGRGNDDGRTETCVSADGKVAIAAGVVMDLTQWKPFFGCGTTRCARLSDEVRRAGLDQEVFRVDSIVPDSTIALADIHAGDLLLDDLSSFEGLKPGDVVKITVIRDGKKEIHPVKLQATPRTIGIIPYAIKSSILHPSGELMMAGGMKFYSPTQGSLVGRVELKQYTNSDCAGMPVFSPDGSMLVMASHWIVGIDIANGRLAWELPGHLDWRPVESMALSMDESLLATVSQEEAIVWDLKKQKEVVTIKTHKNHWEAYNACVSISPDATRLITGSKDGMYVWDISTGRLLRSFPKVSTYEIKWTTDGRCMITRNGGWVNIWGIEGANQMLEAREVKCKALGDLRALNNSTSNQGSQNLSLSALRPAPVATPHDTESESVAKPGVPLSVSMPVVDGNVVAKEANQPPLAITPSSQQQGAVAELLVVPSPVKSVLQSAIDAHGGVEKLAAATSITFTSRVTEINGPIHTVQSTYDLASDSLREVWTRTVLGFKNETTFIISPAAAWIIKDGKVSPMDATRSTNFKNKIRMMRATFFNLPADQYIPIDGQCDSRGNPASSMKVKIDDNTDLILLFDPKTSLVYEQQMTVKQGNRIAHITIRLAALREFDGVKMATSQYTLHDGKGYTETVIQKVKIGGKIDKEIFQKPSPNTTGFKMPQNSENHISAST